MCAYSSARRQEKPNGVATGIYRARRRTIEALSRGSLHQLQTRRPRKGHVLNFAFLKKAAPFIAAVAGSAVPVAAPFLGLAAKKLSDGLGVKVDATADSIKDAISSAMGDPEKLGKLKQIDNEFAEHMKQLDIESAEKFEELAAGDRANAREMQIKMPSRLPGILAVVVTAGF